MKGGDSHEPCLLRGPRRRPTLLGGSVCCSLSLVDTYGRPMPGG